MLVCYVLQIAFVKNKGPFHDPQPCTPFVSGKKKEKKKIFRPVVAFRYTMFVWKYFCGVNLFDKIIAKFVQTGHGCG